MRLFNIYFSPTGNTKKVADVIVNELSDEVINYDLFNKDNEKLSLNKEDLSVISLPVFGGRIPEYAKEKIIDIEGNGSKAVIITVFGNRAIDDALLELKDVIKSSKFQIAAGIEAVAEHSLARIYGTGRPDKNDIKELKEFAKIIKGEIIKEKDDVKVPGNFPYRDFKRAPMKPVVDASCINCKLCAKKCPVSAISFDNVKIIDEDKCFSCMHCVSVCPMGARHNAPAVTKMFEDKLKDRCREYKTNKLYI